MTKENRGVWIWQTMTVVLIILILVGLIGVNEKVYNLTREKNTLEWEVIDANWKIQSLNLKYQSLERDYEELLLLQSNFFLKEHPNDIYIFSDSRRYLAGNETKYYAAMVLYQSTNPASVLHYAVENTKYIHGRTYIEWDGPGNLINIQGVSYLTIEGLEIGPVDRP